MKNRLSAKSQSAKPCRRPWWPKEMGEVLLTEARLRRRVRALAREIERDYAGLNMVVVPILKGAFFFAADLLRQIEIPFQLDFIGVSSYRNAVRPGRLKFTKPLQLEVRGQHVLVVDDILDQGQTLTRVCAQMRRKRPASIKTCVLLRKTGPRRTTLEPDYVGFELAHDFVFGYGLDWEERYRNMPWVAVAPVPTPTSV